MRVVIIKFKGWVIIWCSKRYIIPLMLNREENASIITQLMTSNKGIHVTSGRYKITSLVL